MAAAGLVADSLAASRWGAWLRTLFTALLTIPAIITPLTPILAPRILPHVFPTADEVMLQNELEAPLIRSAYELQSRLYAMATSNFLIKALETPQPVLIDTAIAGTMYSFARFIAAAERAMEHPDADLGISSSGFFPYRLAPRRQRVNGLIHATMNAMGSRGSSGCTTDLVEMLTENTGATMSVLADAERAETQLCTAGSECRAPSFSRASHCSGDADGAGDSLYDLLDDGRMAWAVGDGAGPAEPTLGSAMMEGAFPGDEDEDLDEAEAEEAASESGWEVLAAEQRAAAAGGSGGKGPRATRGADGSCPAEAEERAACSAARVMARHTPSVACDRTLMLRSGQRRAIAELMLLDRGAPRRAGQLAVAPIMPFHVFAQLVYPVLAPLYENPGLVSTVVRAKAAVHASSIRRAKQQQLQRMQAEAERAASGVSTVPPNPLLWAAVTPLESPPAVHVRTLARGTISQRPLRPQASPSLGPRGFGSEAPASTSPKAGPVQGPWFPSISRASSAAQRATCVLLELLDNSTARAVQAAQQPRTAASLPAASGLPGLEVAARRASLIHWLGPLAGDLVRLLDPTMLCVHRERIIRVQNAALELMLVLDAGPQLFVSSKATSPLAAAAGQHSVLAMASHVLVEVGRLPLVVMDWALQWLGVYGPDAAFTDGVWPSPMPTSRRPSHGHRLSPPADDEDASSGGSRWRPAKLKRLHANDFKACTDIYNDLQQRQAERAEAELSRSRLAAAAARWRRAQRSTGATAA